MVIAKTAELLAKQGWVRKPRLEGASVQLAVIEEVYIHRKYPMLLAIKTVEAHGGGSGIATGVIEAVGPLSQGTVNTFMSEWGTGFEVIKTKQDAVRAVKGLAANYDAKQNYEVQFLR